MDEVRNFPYNTDSGSRRSQIISEDLWYHGESSDVTENPKEVAETLAMVVSELWECRTVLQDLGYERKVTEKGKTYHVKRKQALTGGCWMIKKSMCSTNFWRKT